MLELTIIIGGRAKGKTYLTKKKYLIRDILESNVLIYDCFDEYKGVEEIKISEVAEFSKQKIKSVRRVVSNQQLTLDNEVKLFLRLLKDFKEGLFIGDAFFEMNKSNELNDEIHNMLIKAKHLKEDLHIILHFQNIKSIPKKWLLFDAVKCHEL